MPNSVEREGRVWTFPKDGIDTDAMMPGATLRMSTDDASRYLFSLVREGWVDQISEGDIVVGGTRFGIGSSRPVGQLMLRAGVRCVLAEQMSSLFQRNCINYGLPAMEVPGILEHVEEGDVIHVDVATAAVTNRRTEQTIYGKPFPELVLNIISSGGLLLDLKQAGLIGSGDIV